MVTAKLFKNGRSQAVRLPKDCRFTGTEVGIVNLGNAVLLFQKDKALEIMEQSLSQFTPDFMATRDQPKTVERRRRLMIEFLFDTDICVIHIRNRRAEHLLAHMADHPPDSFAISTVTLAELQFGVAKSDNPAANLEALTQFLAPFAILHFDELATASYGPLRAHLERTGNSIGPLDTLIAAHALARKLILITNNEREFRRVPGLKVENWTKR